VGDFSKRFYMTTNLTTADSVPHYPQEDEKLRATNIVQRRGGNGPNTLEVLQQLIGRGDNEEEPSLVLCSVLPSGHHQKSRKWKQDPRQL
jgi:ketohexokinase